MKLIDLAVEENQENTDYVEMLEKIKKHYKYLQNTNDENAWTCTSAFLGTRSI